MKINDFRKGDLVEAKVRWRIGEDNPFQIADWETELLYPMTVVERARPELPTEPGVYLDEYNEVWELIPDYGWRTRGRWVEDERVSECAPFIRLESVADTARKVLDAVSAEMDNVRWSTSTAAIGAVWDAVRNRFGVAS